MSEPRPTNRAVDVLGYRQPPVPADRLHSAAGPLKAYRFMAFLTGVVLVVATVMLILKEVGVHHMEPETGWLWVLHGWCYLAYVATTAVLGQRLRWPLLRYGLVVLAGTIPTMSFVAEHVVTRAARNAAAQPVAPRA